MTTPVQWWERTRHDPARVISWLQRQHQGELGASRGIADLLFRFPEARAYQHEFAQFVDEETVHANALLRLLSARGGKPLASHVSRYWAAQPPAKTFREALATSGHAEALALVRIQVVADDATAPADIKEVFKMLADDEAKHVAMFRELAGEEALRARYAHHEAGVAALGVKLVGG